MNMERKVLVKKLGEYFGVKPKYLGAPSFAYQLVTGNEVYQVLKDGSIKTSTGDMVSFETLTCDEVSETNNNENENDVVGEFEIVFPLKDHTGKTLLNLVNMLASKQNLLIPALELNTSLVEEQFSEAMNATTIMNLEDFKAQYEAAGPEHCPGLSINFNEGLITFRIRGDQLRIEQLRAFSDLAVFINKNAKQFSRTSPKPAQVTNPKYSLRTWLIRLGMNGEEFREVRKVLLSNLYGNSAFRSKEVNHNEA
jgi:hypothetical protein